MITFLTAPLFLALPIGGALCLYLWRQKNQAELPLLVLLGAATIWSTFYGLEIALENEVAMLWSVKLAYLGILAAPVGWLLLGLHLHSQLQARGRRFYILLLAIPALTLVLVWTNELHYLFWTKKTVVEFNGQHYFKSEYGPFFWLHLAYGYTLNTIGAGLVLASLFTSQRFYLLQRIVMGIALFLPWTANATYVFRIEPFSVVDLSPFALVISTMLMIFGVFRYRIGDIIPIARDHVFSRMTDGILLFDAPGRLIDANDAGLAVLTTPEQAIGKSAAELLGPHLKVQQMLASGTSHQERFYDGFENRVFHITVSSIKPEGSERESRLLVLRDLSLTRQAEGAIKLIVEGTSDDMGADFFRSLVRGIGLAVDARTSSIGLLDPDNGGLINTLAVWDRDGPTGNFSYSLDGAPGFGVINHGSCLFPNNVAEMFPDDKALVEMGIKAYVGTPICNANGDVLGLMAVLHDKPLEQQDLTLSILELFAQRASAELERRKSEARLRASEVRYRQIVETTQDGVCVLDAEGLVEFANQPLADMLNIDKQEVLNHDFWSLFDSLEVDWSSNANEVIESLIRLRDGTSVWLNVSKSVIKSDAGEITGMLLMLTNVTQQRLLKKENELFESQLRQSQKLESIGVLAGGIAHDFNNLLMPILGYVDLIGQRFAADVQVSSYIQQIRDAGNRLSDLCNQMLTYSGKGQLQEKSVNINLLLGEMREFTRVSVSREHQIRYDLGEGDYCTDGDPTQLHQVVMNLMLNASEAIEPRKSGKIIVRSGSEELFEEQLAVLRNGDQMEPGVHIYLEVEDNGAGIESGDLERMFEPFYTTKFTGRGLGMAVVYGIVRAHAGGIEIDSRPQIGTRIRVYLPERKDGGSQLFARVGAEAEAWQASGTILLVDDEDFVREIERELLKSLGFTVVDVGSAMTALSKFEQHSGSWTGCIIDYTMPDMNGIQLLERIRGLDQEVPVVLTSGYNQGQVTDAANNIRGVSFLQKPFEISQLKKCLISAGIA